MFALRRVVATAVLTSGALMAGLGTAPTAFAHAEIKATFPAAGSTVHGTLTQVAVTFDEAVELVPHALRVTTDVGIPIQLETPRLNKAGTVLSARIQDHLATGGYAVAWRVMADDGHVENDTFTFSVAAAGTGDRPTPATAAGAPPPTSPGEPLWPVFVAIGIALVGGVGAGLAVRRGLRIVAAESAAAYQHGASPEEHASSRLRM